MTPAKRLPYFPPPKAHESLNGYLLHLAIKNGYDDSLAVLYDVAGYKGLPKSFEKFNLTRLAELTGQTEETLRSHTYQKASNSTRLFMGHEIQSYLLTYRTLKFCPICIEPENRFKTIWDLALMTACCQHKTRLISTCHACKKPISWHRTPWFKCLCGHDVREAPTTQVDSETLEVNALLSRAFDACERPKGNNLPQDIWEIAPGDLHRIFSLLCYWANGDFDFKISSWVQSCPDDVRAAMLLQARRVFIDWPTNFYAFLDGCRNRAPSPSAHVLLHRELGTLYDGLMYKSTDPKCEFIKDALRDYGKNISIHEDVDATDLTRLTEVAKSLGIGQSAALRMAKAGNLALSKVSGGFRKSKVVIKDTESNKSKDSLGDRISLQEVARQMGIGIKLAKSLADEGYFTGSKQLIRDGRSNTSYSLSEVTKLLEEILAAVSVADECVHDELQTVIEAMRIYCINGLEKSELLRRITKKRLPAYIKANGKNLREVNVRTCDLRKIVVSHINTDPKLIELSEAAERYNVKKSALHYLTSAGSLRHSIKSHGARKYIFVSKKDIEKRLRNDYE